MKIMKGWQMAVLGCAVCVSFSTSHVLVAATTPRKPAGKQTVKKPTNALMVQGRVKASTRPPRPRSVPYRDAVIALRLTGIKVLQGKLGAKEIVVFTWGMRNNKWTPAASYRAGQVVRLRLTPWEKAERKYGSYNRFELQGNDVYVLDAYWGEVQ